MAISKSLLADGEYVELSVRAHAKAVIWPCLVLVLVVGGVISVLLAEPNNCAVALAAAVVAVPVLVLGSVVPFLRWRSSTYTVEPAPDHPSRRPDPDRA